ncbi:general odorant-binding protein 19d [Drosophila kikkawai]|uniref:General odorant-binding protein 19d n=1 Tax=Drosophila kikkawai TaxID=30033 RepID=A0A6P4J118_DROKI|nr:uncharacterized protein LOC108079225 [Drosophila kikkawai]KAH8343395.1 hypothetical protein KR059_009987 [Drosophila kikkawai]
MKPFAAIIALLAGILILPSIEGQNQAFDLAKLMPKSGSQPIWTVINRNLPQVQEMINAARKECLQQLGLPKDQRPLMQVASPTAKEKCLMECVLKKIKLMDGNNKLNVGQVEKLASLVTQDNKVAIALSCGMAQTCNRIITVKDSCEAAHQFNQCIGRQLDRNSVKLVW